MKIVNTWDDENTGDDFSQAGDKVGDVDVPPDVLGVEGQAVVDHGHHKPREVHDRCTSPHLRGLDNHLFTEGSHY
jgi:hypothetical protein